MGKMLIASHSFVKGGSGLLLLRRGEKTNLYPGLWECPWGIVEDGQSVPYSRMRTVRDKTGLMVEVASNISSVDYYVIGMEDEKLQGANCTRIFSIMRVVGGDLALGDVHDTYAWATYESALRYQLTPEVHRAAEALSEYLF